MIFPLKPTGLRVFSKKDITLPSFCLPFTMQCFHKLRPLPWVAGKQLLVLQVLLMKNRMRKMPLITGAIFFAHLQSVEDMDLGAGYMNFYPAAG